MAWKEFFIYNITNTSLAGGTGTVFTDTTVKMDADADFEFAKLSHVATNSQIYLQFQDDAFGRYYQNTKVDLRNISADHTVNVTPVNFNPYPLSEPVILQASATLTASLSDFSTAANSLRLALHGAKIRDGDAPWERDWKQKIMFTYVINQTLSANQTVTFNVPINIDSDFLVKTITGSRTGPALVTIKETGTDKQWSDSPVHFDNLVGFGLFPNALHVPRLAYRGSALSVQVQDISGASNTIIMHFSGKKLYE